MLRLCGVGRTTPHLFYFNRIYPNCMICICVSVFIALLIC